mgnify:CR=1 FL=1
MRSLIYALPLIFAACAPNGSNAASGDAKTTSDGKPFNVEVIADFDEPWAMTFMPDGNALISEKKGKLIWRNADGNSVEVLGVPEVDYGGQGGFGDVVLSPDFAKDKMKLRVPIPKIESVGMRKLSEAPIVEKSLKTVQGRARIKRTMWSRRAQEYDAKINSGDLIQIAEVVRDLFRSDTQPEQSYSERQLYEAALERLTREVAAVAGGDEVAAAKQVGDVLESRVAA